jgi:DNA polymerase
MPHLRRCGITRLVPLDFETFYDKDYSLSKMPMQQYILDDRFEPILLSWWDSASSDASPSWVPRDNIPLLLASLELEREGTLTIAHNAQFDAGILWWRYGIAPWKVFCTMMGARPSLVPYSKRNSMALSALSEFVDTGAKGGYVSNAKGKRFADFSRHELRLYAEYGAQDTAICRDLALRILPTMPPEEIDLVDLTVKQFTQPKVRFDGRKLRSYLASIKRKKARLLQDAGVSDPGELRSNQKFAELLTANGLAELPRKISPTTGEETFAFAKNDAEFKRLVLQSDNEAISLLGEARVGHKTSQAETRAERFIALADLDTPVGLPSLYWGAHTGRDSGYGKLNIQNLPRGGELRKAVCAPKGYRLVAGDLSQIEVRVLAWLADETKLLNVFANGLDPYKSFASEAYNVSYNAVTKEQRRIAKSAVLGLGFGMGPDRFLEYLAANGVKGVDYRAAKKLVWKYRETYQRIATLWQVAEEWLGYYLALSETKMKRATRFKSLIIAPGFIGMPNGMSLRYPNLHLGSDYNWKFGADPSSTRKIYGPKVIENVVQALARIIIMRAAVYLYRRGMLSIFRVHDELVYCVRKDQWRDVVRILQAVLNRPVPWAPELVIESEIKVGTSYGNMRVVA